MMGVSVARVIKDGGVKGYVGYQNTSDYLMDLIKQEKQAVDDYTSYDGDKNKLDAVDVVFWTPYASGSYWHGKADLDEGVVVEGSDVYGQLCETPKERYNRLEEDGPLEEAVEHSKEWDGDSDNENSSSDEQLGPWSGEWNE